MTEDAIPEGFVRAMRSSAYTSLAGPLYERRVDGDYRIGLRVDERHTNRRGFCHGALIALFADVELGRVIGYSRTPRLETVTVNLDLSYMAPARLGDWLEATGRIDRIGKRTAYSSGLILANGVAVARAAGVFHLIGDTPRTA
ncbi:MAG: PaaI family thioesterase [Aliidongia sp.]